MPKKMTHTTAMGFARKITNRTRDLLKFSESRVWFAGHENRVHPVNDLGYWRHVRDVAILSAFDAQAMLRLAESEIDRLKGGN